MAEPMRLLEFVCVHTESKLPYVGLFDVKDISRIIQHDLKHCNLILKDGNLLLACGNLRTLTNRWIYTLEKKHSFYQDDIIRPSVTVYHRPENLGSDSSFFDQYQLVQFVTALRPELLTNEQYKDIFYTI